MEVGVYVDKKKVYDKVAMLTAYVGAKTATQDGTPLYAQVFTTPESQELLVSFWNASLEDLTETSKQYFAMQDGEGFILQLPMDFDIEKETLIGSKAEEYCVANIVAKWFAITAPQLAEIYIAEAQAALSAYGRVLEMRTIPKRM